MARPLDIDTTRRVWAVVTRQPTASLTVLGRLARLPRSTVYRHLCVLRAAGYVGWQDKECSARRVLVPFVEVAHACPQKL